MARVHSSVSTSAQPLVRAGGSTGQPNPSRTKPKTRQAAKKRKFYIVTGVISTKGGGLELLNEEALFHGGPPIFVPPQGRRGFRNYPVAPLFVADKRLGRIDWDFEE